MLVREYEEAERLAQEHDETGLQSLRQKYAKRRTYAAYVGLFALGYLFFGNWLARELAAGFVADHPEVMRLAYLLIGGLGLGLYFALSKRYSDRSDRIELALKLQRREASLGKDGG